MLPGLLGRIPQHQNLFRDSATFNDGGGPPNTYLSSPRGSAVQTRWSPPRAPTWSWAPGGQWTESWWRRSRPCRSRRCRGSAVARSALARLKYGGKLYEWKLFLLWYVLLNRWLTNLHLRVNVDKHSDSKLMWAMLVAIETTIDTWNNYFFHTNYTFNVGIEPPTHNVDTQEIRQLHHLHCQFKKK